MSRAPLTKEQQAAADRPGDACVMAGAGSGKTTVLTARFFRLVEKEGIDPRRVAALTFTEKAADEMRERIAEAFADPGRPPEVRKHARDVEFAPISTIHAFCARLLREHAIDAGVDPAFSLLDATAATLLLEDAFEGVHRRRRATEGPHRDALRLLGDERSGASVRTLLERIRGDGVPAGRLSWRRGPTTLLDALDGLRGAHARLLDEAANAGLDAAGAAALRADLDRLPRPESLAAKTFEAARRADAVSDAKAIGRVVRVGKTKALKPLRDALLDLALAYAAVAGAILDEVGERDVLPHLRDLLVACEAEYARKKRALGALDFTDLELATLDLLERLAAKGRAPEGAPLSLLVDEFQDTNPLQLAILERLRRPASARPGGPAPVPRFAVGDAKQSIYRFRRADVSGILAAWEEAGPDRRTSLTESFRSRPELVAFHNALFRRLFAGGAAGVAAEDIVAKARFGPGPAILPEVLVVDAGATGHGDATGRRLAEARTIAKRIAALVDGKAPRTKFVRAADGTSKPDARTLGYGDVAILLRARKDVKVYERALMEAGIPFHVGRGRGFYQTEEIADLLHLLRVVHDPLDRFAVAAWMTSPAVGATDAEVLDAFSAKEGPFDALRNVAATAPAVAAIERLRRLAAGGPLEVVVEEAVAVSGAVPAALLQDGGERRARNLAKAVAIARRLDAEGDHGLHDYLRRLTDLKDREVDEAEAAAGADERASVAILTIHGAKGLEWPCVIVADVGRQEAGGFPPAFRVDRDGACAWRLRDPVEGEAKPSGGYAALAATEKTLEAEESLRLLYVAATRAEERLLVTMTASGTNSTSKDGGPLAPKDLAGWGKAIWSQFGLPLAFGRVETDLDGARVAVTVEAPLEAPSDAATNAPWVRRFRTEGLLDGTAEDGGAVVRAAAREHWARVDGSRAPRPTLGKTPFVVTISDLLAFAASPQAYYRERLLGPAPRPVSGGVPSAAPDLAREADDPAARSESDGDRDARASVRDDRLDEGRETLDGVDRAALGRTVHLAIERFAPGADVDRLVAEAAAEEFGGDAPLAARAAALAMVRRFLASATGREVAEALARGTGVRREVAFHARIAFPEKEPVGPFDSLLVKGTVDLWLDDAGGAGGARILDHKTNSPRGPHQTPAALVAHYAPQLRLYALAAERMPGAPKVASASLLLLDPEWERLGVPVEAPVDVSGPALLETRRLCRAMATALMDDRYLPDWRTYGVR